MDDVTQFVIRHANLVLFAAVFADQVGLPFPAVPVLLAAGALAGAGQMNLGMAVGLAVAACFVGDFVWYYLGRHRGRHVLNVLCRISFEPDSCVRRTENFFGRHGMRSLILAKFIPGVSTVTPALAGLFNVSVERFMLYNGLGALLWTVTYIAPGYLFSDQLELRHHEIPRDRDVILYCACPNEATAARMALLLKKNGITRVRPLAGGVEAWRQRNYPLEELGVGVA